MPSATLAPPLSPSPADVRKPGAPPSPDRRPWWGAFVLIAILGIGLRVIPTAGFTGMGFDESLYRAYVQMLDKTGFAEYPAITEYFLRDQRKPESITKLPPTRFLYIACGWVWKRAQFGSAPPLDISLPGNIERDPALVSLHRVSCLFSVGVMLLIGLAATRMLGAKAGLGALALAACSPLQMHMAQHALIDGFFAFWATLSLWLLWENLRKPDRTGWAVAFGASLAAMVMCKENSFFVWVTLMALVGLNRWTRWGTVTPRLLLASALGPLVGVIVLVWLAGGVDVFIEVYRLLVTKAQKLDYAIKTGDGPWHRYIVDSLVVQPLVVLLAIGALWKRLRDEPALLFLAGFIAISYLGMSNVRYAMNLRYATVWELPLIALAFAQLAAMAQSWGRRRDLLLVLATVALCAYGVRQYGIFFVEWELYELGSEGLFRAVKMVK